MSGRGKVTTHAFEVKGDLPQWRLVYDILPVPAEPGTVITFEALSEALGYDFKKNRTPLYKAAQEWGREHSRALWPVINVGYRVIEATEHEALARSHHKRSRKALRRSRNAVATADRSRLSAEDRKRFDMMELNLSRQQDMIRRLEARTEKVEKVSVKAAADSAANAERLAKLEEALQRHGIQVGDAA